MLVLVSWVLSSLLSFIEKAEGAFLFINYPESFLVIDTFVRGTFIIFAATLISELIISEFKDKTITVLFMYPISRKKLMAAKLLVIMLFTFFAIVISKCFCIKCILPNQFEY